MDSIIEIKSLNKSFGDNKVLNNINLSINKGDIYGILGLSGAGKSTLVRCINGLEKADSGDIIYKGCKVTFDREYRKNVSMIFQSFNLLQQRNMNFIPASFIFGFWKKIVSLYPHLGHFVLVLLE